jgi:L-iditol 2-dehydrogenase
MRASVLFDVGRLEVRDLPTPEVGPRDVLVRTAVVGLCGTDLHIFSGEANYNIDASGRQIPLSIQPQILGHEVSGTIAETGGQVRDVKIGERVVFDQGLNCFSAGRSLCEYCTTGDSHQCENYQELGITGLQGGLAEYVSVPAVNTIPVKSELDLTEAALTEPLACIVHCFDVLARASSARYLLSAEPAERRVKSVLIIGAGPAGLLFTQYLRNVVGFEGLLLVSEPNRKKRELAAQSGAEVMNPSESDLVEWVTEKTRGRKVELLIDACGSASVFSLIPGVLRKQASVALYGHGHGGADLSLLNTIQFLEPNLVSTVGGSGGFEANGRPSTYTRALQLLEAGSIRVAPMLSHKYRSLEGALQALTVDYFSPDYIKGAVIL